METLNIILNAANYPPFPLAGGGRFALNLSNSIKKHNITLITNGLKGIRKEEKKDNVTIKRINNLFTNILSNPNQNKCLIDRRILFGVTLRKYLRKNINLKDYDILHNIDCLYGSFLNYPKINKKIPTLTSIGEYYLLASSWNPFKLPYKSTDFVSRYFHHNIFKYFQQKTLRNTNRIACLCKFIHNLLQKKLKIPEEKMSVVYRGINTDRFNVKPSKDKYNSKKILFIGANMERKGALDLVMSSRLVLKKHPDAHFIIVGSCSTKYKNLMNRFIRKKENFTFINSLKNEDTIKLYKVANIFVMPSKAEGLGQVFLEAMTSKTPVIGTKVGGVTEIIDNNGYLVNVNSPNQIAEKIIKILDDPNLAKKLGKNGHKYVLKNHSLEKQREEYIDLYRRMIR